MSRRAPKRHECNHFEKNRAFKGICDMKCFRFVALEETKAFIESNLPWQPECG